MNLEHGEIYGRLKVLRKLPSGRYRCGCSCGSSKTTVRAKALMSGRVKSCRKCLSLSQGDSRYSPSCKDSVAK